MQFNTNSDSQDLVSLVVDATGLSATNDIKQITRACNRANKIIWSWIFDAYGGWQYDDSNNADLPVATATITSAQQKYSLPTGAITVRNIEVKDEGGIWNKLRSLSIDEINQFHSENEFLKTDGSPIAYSLIDGVLKLYPASDYTQTESIRAQFDRGSTSFASTDTTKTPGFVSDFHEAVGDGASYFIVRDKLKQKNLIALREDWDRWESKIKKYYNKRFQEEFPSQLKQPDYVNNFV